MKFQWKNFQPERLSRYTQWALLLTALATLLTAAAYSVRESTPSAVYTDVDVNSPVHYSSNESASQENASTDAANSKNIKNSDTYFVIRAFEDTVAIFESDGTTPIYMIDTPLSRLTASDRTLLTAGIRVETLAEAYKRIEDYE